MKRNEKLIILITLLISGVIGFIFSLYQHHNMDSISPQSADTQLIQTFHYPALFVKQLAGDPLAGKKIFKEFCAACHSKTPLIDISAPRIGDKEAWNTRRLWGMTALLNITVNGKGAMPARGGCFECSDDQLKEAIKYMLNAK